MYLSKTFILLVALPHVLLAGTAKETVFMDFEIPPIIQYDSYSSKEIQSKKISSNLTEYPKLITGVLSSNIPWECSVQIKEEFPEGGRIKLKGPKQKVWKNLTPYKEIIIASGQRATQDEKLSVNFLTSGFEENLKRPVEIIFTVKSQYKEEIKKIKKLQSP